MDVPFYVYAAGAYALLGLALGICYRFGVNLRQSAWVHLGTVASSALGLLPALALALADDGTLSGDGFREYHRGARGLLFLAAGFCHLPVWVYIGVYHAGRWIERLHSAARRGPEQPTRRTRRQEWHAAKAHLEALAKNPLDARRREALAQCYLALGSIDGAIREYRKAAECVETGYDQSRLMYKAVRLLVDRKSDTESALPLIRRMIRLYPRSYFSAYARRVLHGHEAHEAQAREHRGRSVEGEARDERETE